MARRIVSAVVNGHEIPAHVEGLAQGIRDQLTHYADQHNRRGPYRRWLASLDRGEPVEVSALYIPGDLRQAAHIGPNDRVRIDGEAVTVVRRTTPVKASRA